MIDISSNNVAAIIRSADLHNEFKHYYILKNYIYIYYNE